MKRLLLTCFIISGALLINAQPPTSLQYPSSNNFIANVTSVSIAPTLSGSTTGLTYSISPALPSGLLFNTSTGLISGTPIIASNSTSYTVTATNPSGSTNKNITIAVTNAYFNNAYDSVFFNITDTLRKIGTGTNAGDVILYQNVRTIGGQSIDCIVKTRSFTAGTTFSSYDQPLVTDGSTFNSNNPRYFSPQLVFPTGGGNVIFDFQFILGGSYNDLTGKGINVTLQNVKLNTYDIDGNGTASSNQFNEFAGFDTSEVSSSTTIKAAVFDTVTNLTKYESNISTNSLMVTADATRIRLTYSNMNSFSIQVGAGATGAAYFFLDFSSGPVFNTAVKSTPPLADLNTSAIDLGNGALGCSSSLAFTAPSQTNASSTTVLSELNIDFDNTVANLPDGSGEQLLINGFTAGTGSFPLNFSTGSTANVTVGGINYTVTKSVAGTTNSISFKNGASTFTLADAETLLDALRYDDTLNSPTTGDRTFVVTIRNTQFISPEATFIASIKCISIAGNIFHDANGLSDNTVNANGSAGQLGSAGAYAVLTNASTNTVLATVPILSGGAYNFGRTDPGNYNIFISNTSSPGSTITSPTYPTGNYKSTGENLGVTAGNDGLIDGKFSVVLGTVAITNANFGIQTPPVTADSIFVNQPNPGGFNYFTIPAGGFKASDADGTVDSLVITAFPTGANYIKVGSTIYTNGGTCPPQLSCVAWPGTLRLLYSAVGTISVDPTSAGNTSVSLTYTVKDNGQAISNSGVPSTITIPFVVSSISVSGTVWNDPNANGIKDAGEAYTAAASPGQTLYALLVQKTNTYSGSATIYGSTIIVGSSSGYSFSNVPPGNSYDVRIVSLASAPSDGIANTSVSAALATNYIGVSTNNNGVISANQNTNNLVNALGTVNATKINVNFGIEQTPVADSKSFTAPSSTFTYHASPTINGHGSFSINGNSTNLSGSSIKSLSGSDNEDCASASSCTTGKTYLVQTLNSNTLLYYNFGSGSVNVAPGTTITNFDPANLTIYGESGQGYSSGTAFGFTYSLVDNAGIASPAVTYTITTTGAVLEVTLISFKANVTNCTATLNWQSGFESGIKEYVVEQSNDAQNYEQVAVVASNNLATGSSYEAKVSMLHETMYYRLKIVNANQSVSYSSVVMLRSVNCSNTMIAVYPNPASGKIRITGLQSNAEVIIYDLDGKVVMQLKDVKNNQLIDVAQLPEATYLVKSVDNTHTAYTRLIKK